MSSGSTLEVAQIRIKDKRSQEISVEENAAGSGSGLSLGSASSLLSKVATSVTKSVNGLDSLKKALESSSDSGTGTTKILEVQFNPSELSFSANGGFRNKYSTMIKGEGKQKSSSAKNSEHLDDADPAKPFITMSLSLYFDKTNASDAFFWSTSQADFLSTAKNAIKSSISEEEYTVQPYVEALLSALRNEQTRCVEFVWGDMIYEGVLNKVETDYTMFNTSGKPIRAKVDLGLNLMADNICKAQWKYIYSNSFL